MTIFFISLKYATEKVYFFSVSTLTMVITKPTVFNQIGNQKAEISNLKDVNTEYIAILLFTHVLNM